MKETWNRFYITIQRDSKKYTFKCEHYKSYPFEHNDLSREFVRVYGENFDYKEPAWSQAFGFGKTVEGAMADFFQRIDTIQTWDL
jgi:hypothetical protein